MARPRAALACASRASRLLDQGSFRVAAPPPMHDDEINRRRRGFRSAAVEPSAFRRGARS
jgi:hypothetical protein